MADILSRRVVDRGVRPVRSAHLGLGAFFRAHQAWYTEHADPGWGIAAFTGRSPVAAETLARQDGLYTLIERGPAEDSARVMSVLSRVAAGSDQPEWTTTIANANVSLLTLTITEVGYQDDAVTARILDGLRARRQNDAGPLAIISCDNLSNNGEVISRALLERADAALSEWIHENVDFISTMVDRITPATTKEDLLVAETLTGYLDASPVVTEPFSEWVLSGPRRVAFPAWETVGAQWVDDLTPFENRKLWLLNGGHSLLAYVGLARGHRFVADAFADDHCRQLLEQLWADAGEFLVNIDDYLDSVRTRFANPRMRHSLEQIARDGATKLRLRLVPWLSRRLERTDDPGTAAPALIAAWAAHDGLGADQAVATLGLDSIRTQVSKVHP